MTIYLIEKIWVDPMENRDADGYAPHGYVYSEEAAVTYCASGRMYTKADCWSLMFGPKPEFIYRPLQLLPTIQVAHRIE